MKSSSEKIKEHLDTHTVVVQIDTSDFVKVTKVNEESGLVFYLRYGVEISVPIARVSNVFIDV